ncbi:MAG: hypothetical protein C4563_07650 [Desulfobulbus sp.]|nr:MAG: hypothetical protein C4563_07650 [Desulfobulbus sp.]
MATTLALICLLVSGAAEAGKDQLSGLLSFLLIKSLFTVTPSAVGMGKVWGDPIVRPGKIALWDLPLKLKKN